MRDCFYHTDLGEQNAVFHNIAIQIAIIQYGHVETQTMQTADRADCADCAD